MYVALPPIRGQGSITWLDIRQSGGNLSNNRPLIYPHYRTETPSIEQCSAVSPVEESSSSLTCSGPSPDRCCGRSTWDWVQPLTDIIQLTAELISSNYLNPRISLRLQSLDWVTRNHQLTFCYIPNMLI